jgi:hypothetical protein
MVCVPPERLALMKKEMPVVSLLYLYNVSLKRKTGDRSVYAMTYRFVVSLVDMYISKISDL